MSLSSKITDDGMKYFQFKARQLFLLRKEDHEWKEFCKKNTCTCCSCQTNVTKESKEVDLQSSPKRILPTSRNLPASHNYARSTSSTLHPNKNLPQALNEIKTKLEKLDVTLSQMNLPSKSEMKEVIKPKDMFSQRLNSLTLPIESEMAESVKSVINERRMQLIQDSLKMSLQRLQSAALRNTRSNSNVKVKKKNSGYFIPRELERQRAAARRAYLASLEKTAVQSKVLPHSVKEKTDSKKESLKPKLLKATTKSNLRKFNKKKKNEKEDVPTLVESDKFTETKDENIETAVDAIMDDILGETVLVINKIKQSKCEKSSTVMQNSEVPYNVPLRNFTMDLVSQAPEAEMIECFQNKMKTIRKNLQCVREATEPKGDQLEPVEIKSKTKEKNTAESEQFISPGTSSNAHLKGFIETKNKHLRDLSIDPVKIQQISKCRKEYWSYLEKISRSKKGNFDPWKLSNMVAESLLDDCIQEISEELQDMPATLVADLYDQEFLQSV